MKTWWKFAHWFVFRLRIYVAWSWLYNQFRNRKYRKVWERWLNYCDGLRAKDEVDDLGWKKRSLRMLNLVDIQEALDLIQWKEDTWRALWDAIAWPERMLFWISCKAYPPTNKADPRHALWRELGMKQPESEMDCDDFTAAAMWMVYRMDDRIGGDYPIKSMRNYFLNVARLEGKSFWGHNLCAVEFMTSHEDGTREVEWRHVGNWGTSNAFPTLRKTIEDVRGDLPLVGWAVMYPGNKLIERSGKLPPESFLDPRPRGKEKP